MNQSPVNLGRRELRIFFLLLLFACYPSQGLSQQASSQQQQLHQQMQRINQRMAMLRSVIDSNQDGRLSSQEIDNAATSLARLDRDRDGQLSADESHGGKFPAPERIRLDWVFNFIDEDGDIIVSAAEIANAPAALRQLDENRDGEISADEMLPAPGPPPAFFGNPPQMERIPLWSSKMRDRNYESINGPILPGIDKRAYPGYSFYFGSYSSDRIQVQEGVFLRDPQGRIVHRWHNNLQTPDGSSAYLLDNGLLLRTAARYNWKQLKGFPLGANGVIELVDWDSNVLWSFDYCQLGRYCLHHDVAAMPNGNILAIVFEQMNYAEAAALGWAGSRTKSGSVYSERIIEIKPDLASGDASIVWQWDARDHFIQDRDPKLGSYGEVAAYPGKIDVNFEAIPMEAITGQLFHFNAIDYSPELDQIIVSSAVNSEVWIIDHAISSEQARGSAGDLLYRFGNPAVYRAGSRDDQVLFWQHDTHWTGKRGEIQLFNNGAKRGRDGRANPGELFLGLLDGAYSDVLRLQLPIQTDGRYDIARPAEITWHYNADASEDFYSPFMSSARTLPNGNVLMIQSYNNRVIEVTTEGEKVEDYQLPEAGHLFRIYKIPAHHPGLAGRKLSP